MQLIKTIKTSYNTIYIYKEGEKFFVFKPSRNIEKEILANRLAKIFGVKTLEIEPFEINNTKGIKMDYITKSTLLMHYKQELDKTQIQDLKRIILFDIWVGNKDRHTANIFVNKNLIAFDHEKVFNKAKGRQCIKLDAGRRLRKDYVDIIEKLIDRKLTVKEVLLKLGFKEFPRIKKEDIENIVENKELLEFLLSRADFNNIYF